MTIAVYKTDVDDPLKAGSILYEIRRHLPGSEPSFDLDDCDNVLRIENPADGIAESDIENILGSYGYAMEPLL